MAGLNRPWALAGGWAVDAWLGHQTRSHGDVDILVAHRDQRALFDHLADWNMVAHDPPIAGGGSNSDAWDGHHLTLPAHIHARPPGAANREAVRAWVTPPYRAPRDDMNVEIILDDIADGRWTLSDEPKISLPVHQCFDESSRAVPCVRPVVLMFFKALAYRELPGYPRPHDEADFWSLEPLVSADERGWLGDCVRQVKPSHPWLERLAR